MLFHWRGLPAFLWRSVPCCSTYLLFPNFGSWYACCSSCLLHGPGARVGELVPFLCCNLPPVLACSSQNTLNARPPLPKGGVNQERVLPGHGFRQEDVRVSWPEGWVGRREGRPLLCCVVLAACLPAGGVCSPSRVFLKESQLPLAPDIVWKVPLCSVVLLSVPGAPADQRQQELWVLTESGARPGFAKCAK